MIEYTFALISGGLFGLIFGSFSNVLIYRLPRLMDEDSATPLYQAISTPSCCPRCSTRLKALDLVPVASWVCLRGQCRYCATPISARYPLVELLGGALGLLASALLGPTPQAIAGFVLLLMLMIAALIDHDSQWLPDSLTLPLLWLGLLVSSTGVSPNGITATEAVFGATGGYLILRLIDDSFHATTGKRGLGGGDAKLLGALGAWLGWQVLPYLLLAAGIIGLVMAILRRRRDPDQVHFAFGPALAISGSLFAIFGWLPEIAYLIFATQGA